MHDFCVLNLFENISRHQRKGGGGGGKKGNKKLAINSRTIKLKALFQINHAVGQ